MSRHDATKADGGDRGGQAEAERATMSQPEPDFAGRSQTTGRRARTDTEAAQRLFHRECPSTLAHRRVVMRDRDRGHARARRRGDGGRGRRQRERRRCRRTNAPTTTTSRPDTSVSHGQLLRNDERGQSERDEPERAPAVWGDVTVPPRRTACRGVLFVPTRYAATMAFRAWGERVSGSQKAAMRNERRHTQEASPLDQAPKPPPTGLRWRIATRSVGAGAVETRSMSPTPDETPEATSEDPPALAKHVALWCAATVE